MIFDFILIASNKFFCIFFKADEEKKMYSLKIVHFVFFLFTLNDFLVTIKKRQNEIIKKKKQIDCASKFNANECCNVFVALMHFYYLKSERSRNDIFNVISSFNEASEQMGTFIHSFVFKPMRKWREWLKKNCEMIDSHESRVFNTNEQEESFFFTSSFVGCFF